MAYVAVSEFDYSGRTIEKIFQNKPKKHFDTNTFMNKTMHYWIDEIEYDRQRRYSTDAEDGSITLPNGTIEKLIGRKMKPTDKPVEL